MGPAPAISNARNHSRGAQIYVQWGTVKAFRVNYDPSHLVRLGIDYLRFLGWIWRESAHQVTEKILRYWPKIYMTWEISHLFFDSRHDFLKVHGATRFQVMARLTGEVAVRLDALKYKGPISIELEDHYYWGAFHPNRKELWKRKIFCRQYCIKKTGE